LSAQKLCLRAQIEFQSIARLYLLSVFVYFSSFCK
jgi:hypothetical protein